MNDKDIRESKPNVNCKWCEVHNFVDMEGNETESQYAVCTHQAKTQGCVSIDITATGNALLFETSCKDCKYYESKGQLTIFDVGA